MSLYTFLANKTDLTEEEALLRMELARFIASETKLNRLVNELRCRAIERGLYYVNEDGNLLLMPFTEEDLE